MAGPAGGHRHPRRDRGAPCSAATCGPSAPPPRATSSGPIQTIIPWATNHYTETLIARVRDAFRRRISGASGCSAACRAAAWASSSIPAARPRPRSCSGSHDARHQAATCSTPCPSPWSRWSTISPSTDRGTLATPAGRRRRASAAGLLCADGARSGCGARSAAADRRAARDEIARFAAACRTHPRLAGCGDAVRPALPAAGRRAARPGAAGQLLDRTTASTPSSTSRSAPTCGPAASGWRRIACRPAPSSTTSPGRRDRRLPRGRHAATAMPPPGCGGPGRAARWPCLTLAAGAGSRWTQGAGVVKALHPFCRFGGTLSHLPGSPPGQEPPGRPPAVGAAPCRTSSPPATSRMSRSSSSCTREQLRLRAARCSSRRAARWDCGWSPCRATCASPGKKCRSSCWTSRQQKVRDSLHAALIGWAEAAGERQRLHR